VAVAIAPKEPVHLLGNGAQAIFNFPLIYRFTRIGDPAELYLVG
jgi:hypothetical protein